MHDLLLNWCSYLARYYVVLLIYLETNTFCYFERNLTDYEIHPKQKEKYFSNSRTKVFFFSHVVYFEEKKIKRHLPFKLWDLSLKVGERDTFISNLI